MEHAESSIVSHFANHAFMRQTGIAPWIWAVNQWVITIWTVTGKRMRPSSRFLMVLYIDNKSELF